MRMTIRMTTITSSTSNVTIDYFIFTRFYAIGDVPYTAAQALRLLIHIIMYIQAIVIKTITKTDKNASYNCSDNGPMSAMVILNKLEQNKQTNQYDTKSVIMIIILFQVRTIIVMT